MSQNRSDANPNHYTIRRIPAVSSHWRQVPPESTSSNYKDSSNELSIDLVELDPRTKLDEIKAIFKQFIEEKGVGLAYAPVLSVNAALLSGKVEGKCEGQPVIDGKVLNDPLPHNNIHGIITGKDSKNKARLIQSVFQDILEPRKDFFK